MTFASLALIVAVGLLGPAVTASSRWRIPVLLGELAAGIVLGTSGTGTLDPGDSIFRFLGNIGFALVMFVAGTHVPLRQVMHGSAWRLGVTRALATGVVAIPAGIALAAGFGTGHPALYAVILASSSAAAILPTIDALGLAGSTTVELLPQVALADAACIVALPLAIDPGRAGRAALGSLAVIGCAMAAFLLLRRIERSGLRRREHHASEEHNLALELRVSLAVLFAVSAVAAITHVSILLAGFSLGLAVTAVGEPRRLARQLFGLTEGFFGPLFFVWLGASLDLRALGSHPLDIALGAATGLAAIGCHLAGGLGRQRWSAAVLASAQLGVPVAAVTIGTQQGLLSRGEPAALLLGAVITVMVATIAASRLRPRSVTEKGEGPADPSAER